jgi:hypothetical protein
MIYLSIFYPLHFVSCSNIYIYNTIQIKIYKLQTTNYKLQITNYKLQITNYKLQITNYKLQITNYKLQITNYKLQITQITQIIKVSTISKNYISGDRRSPKLKNLFWILNDIWYKIFFLRIFNLIYIIIIS